MSSLRLNPADYPGGIALWGALPAVYDTTQYSIESGVHVHAREVANGAKQIDGSFDTVDVLSGSGVGASVIQPDFPHPTGRMTEASRPSSSRAKRANAANASRCGLRSCVLPSTNGSTSCNIKLIRQIYLVFLPMNRHRQTNPGRRLGTLCLE